jgi:hypothetical protein
LTYYPTPTEPDQFDPDGPELDSKLVSIFVSSAKIEALVAVAVCDNKNIDDTLTFNSCVGKAVESVAAGIIK